jgi:superfamily II DNA or RNA helicase
VFELPPVIGEAPRSISDVYRGLASDARRNRLIVDDIRTAIVAGRSPLVLTERREHLAILAEQLRDAGEVVVLRGGMKAAEQCATNAALHAATDRPRIVLSTGRYLGERFDDPRLDTLFPAMPVACRGTLTQYVGDLHRERVGKRDVLMYDYVDGLVPVRAGMGAKRQTGYRALGYAIAAR